MKRLSRSPLLAVPTVGLLVFQLILTVPLFHFPQTVRADSTQTLSSHASDRLARDLIRATESAEALENETPPNISKIANQKRLRWGRNESGEWDVVETYDLNKLDVSIPDRKVVDPNAQITFEVIPDENQLHIHFLKKKNGRKSILDTHVIGDIHLTAGPIIDEHFIYLPTDQGLRVIPMGVFKEDAFSRTLPAFLAVPLPKEATLKSIHLINRATPPDRYVRLNGDDPAEIFHGGDLGMVIDFGEGKERKVWIGREQLVENASATWLATIILVLIRTRDPEIRKSLLQLLEDHQELIEQQRDIIDELVNNANHNELLSEALVAMAERTSPSEKKTGSVPLASDFRQSQLATQGLIDQFSSDPKIGSWAASYQFIQDRFEAERAKNPDLTFSELLAQGISERFEAEHVEPVLESQKTLRGKFWRLLRGTWNLCTSRKAVAALSLTFAGGLAGVPLADKVSDWMTRIAAKMYQGLVDTTARTIPDLSDALTGLPQFVNEQGWQTLPSWLLGTGLTIAAFFGAFALGGVYEVVKRIKNRKGNWNLKDLAWSSVKTVLNTFVRGYLICNRVLEVIPRIVAGQTQLYRAADHGVSLTSKTAWNAPWKGWNDLAGGDALEEKEKAMSDLIQGESELNAFASRFAAAIIVQEQTGIDVATLLQQEALGEQGPSVVSLFSQSNTAVHQDWVAKTEAVQTLALKMIKESGDLNIQLDPDQIETHRDRYQSLAKKVLSDAGQDQNKAAILANRARTAVQKSSRGFSLWLLGCGAKDWFHRWYWMGVDRRIARMNLIQSSVDYVTSMAIWAGAAPGAFVNLEGRIWAGVAEQEVLWLGQNTNDLQSTAAHSGGQATQPPPAALLFDPESSVNHSKLSPLKRLSRLLGIGSPEKNFVKRQTLFSAITSVIQLTLKHDKEEQGYKGFLENWQQYIKNTFIGMPVRVLITGVPLFLLSFLGSEQTPGTLVAAAAGMSTAIWILLSKYAVRTSTDDSSVGVGTDQFIPGYANVWPLGSAALHMADHSVHLQRKRMQESATQIYRGIELGNSEELREGIRKAKKLFDDAGVELPEELNISADGYDLELGRKFFYYLLSNVPKPNAPSIGFHFLVNFAWGAAISMALYESVQSPLVAAGGASLLAIGWILGWVGATWVPLKVASNTSKVALKIAQPAIKKTGQAIRGVRRLCERYLLGKQPVLLDPVAPLPKE